VQRERPICSVAEDDVREGAADVNADAKTRLAHDLDPRVTAKDTQRYRWVPGTPRPI